MHFLYDVSVSNDGSTEWALYRILFWKLIEECLLDQCIYVWIVFLCETFYGEELPVNIYHYHVKRVCATRNNIRMYLLNVYYDWREWKLMFLWTIKWGVIYGREFQSIL